MKLIVGLGNPGAEYAATRHNAGFWICDNIAKKLGLEFSKRKFEAAFATGRSDGETVVLLKPATYMNVAGRSVGAACSFYGAQAGDLLVLHDDVDLEPGRIKFKQGGGDGGHKGIRSVMDVLGDPEFFRLRLGVGRPADARVDTADFVLAKVPDSEIALFRDASEKAADAALFFLKEGLTATQNRFHGL
ncbi:MAG: aminoacyl-tRNA hydrolase [Deltaproteobacteria bacterium]|nr:aminoacyl-tRNA hydrolase [Deltaproteobacteria bacterium]